MEYKKRTTAPSKTSKYYYSTSNPFYSAGYGMPNCTAYAWGRWYELLGKRPTKLSTRNAENWYTNNDGYKRGKTAKLGAIICWSKGKVGVASDGAGHVAIVEEIKPDGSIITSNSAYKSTNFYLKEIPSTYKLAGYTFQGFIYNPNEYKEIKPSKFVLTRLLRLGVSGEDVKELQKNLTENGWRDAYLRKLKIDGIFGKHTETALKKMQKKRKLVVDGIVGTNTAKSLGWEYKPK